jgi:hypothetical protein
MSNQVIWVWFGENVNKHDHNNWQMLRKLLEMNLHHNHQEIIEINSCDELGQLESQLRASGWQIDEITTQGTPRVTCWKRAAVCA